ncbi:MAG TPA: histidinol-phosphate transaminase [Bacteroidota bacterium]|nr:histidinol-phosphate transaminase [Bacteroidota bacterium]
MNALELIKPGVRALDQYVVKGKPMSSSLIKLNQNENPFDVPDVLKRDAIEEFLRSSWNRYPEVFPAQLLEALAEWTGHPMEGILAGNGSNELMYTVALSIVSRGTKVLIPEPTFFLYEKIIRICEGQIVPVPMNEDCSYAPQSIIDAARREDPALIILVSPNSPTAQSIPYAEIERILGSTRALVLVDEAYIEFSDHPSVQSLIAQCDRLMVLRTFSKAFSLAGLRIGYLLTNPALCSELMKVKVPFAVNAFSASVAMMLLKNPATLNERITYIKDQKKRVEAELRAIAGVKLFPSDTNFLIFKTEHNADELFGKLLADNVLVRDVSSYPMLGNVLRVNIGTHDENNAFLASLKRHMS